MTTLSTKSRKQLDRFMFRVMEPLSEEALIDTHYNLLARNARREAWDKARITSDYLQAKHDLVLIEMIYQRRVLGRSDAKVEHREQERLQLVDEVRVAVAVQIKTPAPDLAALDWKKRKRKDEFSRFGTITLDEMNQCIAEDEAFLTAHPITKQPRRAGRRCEEPVDKSNNGDN